MSDRSELQATAHAPDTIVRGAGAGAGAALTFFFTGCKFLLFIRGGDAGGLNVEFVMPPASVGLMAFAVMYGLPRG
jgi:hypothetical protein